MSGFKYKISGLDKLKKKTEKLTAEILSKHVASTQDATLLLHETAVKLIANRTTGEAQVRYKPKRTVVASKPGDAPNTDTGRAVQSIKFDFKKSGLIGRVGTNLKYLAALEFGTKHTAARPWLSTALKLVQKDMAKIYSDNFTKAIKKGSK